MASEERPEQFIASGIGSTAVKYNFGLIQHHTHLPFLPTAEVAAHDGLIRLSEPRNQVFVGRERELARLRDALRPEDGRTAVVIHGMGGVGKTALALEYAYRYREDHNPILRLPADSPVGMTAALAAFADDLNHLLEPSGLSPDQRATWAKNWLQGHGGWLLILDNAERPADVDALLGSLVGGRILITTRQATGWHARCGTLALDELPEDAAVEFLERLVVDGGERARFRELAGELGCLPLALEQAAAYLNQTRTDPSGYLVLLRDPSADPLAIGPRRDEHERTVARVWQHSLRAAQDENPHATYVLRVLSWFAPDQVPRSLLGRLREDRSAPSGRTARRLWGWTLPYARRRWAQRAGWVKERGRTAHRELTGLEIDRALGVLHAYSLIKLDRESVKVHRLVQSVARTPDTAHGRSVRAARQEAVELLLGAVLDIPDDTRGWVRERELVPHLEALLRLTGPADDGVDTAVLLVRLANYSSRWSRPQEGALVLRHLERADAALRRNIAWGGSHPARTALSSNYTEALIYAGELERAVDRLEHEGRRRGPRGRGLTGSSLIRLARCYMELGRPEQAIPLLKRELATVMSGGGDVRRTLGVRGRLAAAYQAAGWPEHAVAMFERNLFDAEAALGGQDADTCDARENLADAYAASQDPLRAVELYRQSLARREALFGPRHPAVFACRIGLALTYEEAGEPGRAAEVLDHGIAEAGGLFDETLIVPAMRSHRARVAVGAGQPEQALALHEESLADWITARGDRHPDVLHLKRAFAVALMGTGEEERAVPFLEEGLALAEDVFGGSHAETTAFRQLLGRALLAAGDTRRAVPLLERALLELESAAGARPAPVLVARVDRASAYRESGDLERAVSLLEGALYDAEAHCGRRGGVTVAARTALARTYAATGDTHRAVSLLTTAAADAERFLGPGEPLVRRIPRYLAELAGPGRPGAGSQAGPAPAIPDQYERQGEARAEPGAQP
ncbi:tetratricopeptide repeat protein [Streptomyces cyaneofuscatus]|uniref:tetratricopeptide repeat protein n=1 Tax=Streptomyces cyaneofuscatus TaxID=66883 RepID=UPI003796A4DC